MANALTPQEEAQFNAIHSKASKAYSDDLDKETTTDPDWESVANKYREPVKDPERDKVILDLNKPAKDNGGGGLGGEGGIGVDAVVGIGKGTVDAAQNVVNGAITIADWADDAAAQNGLLRSELISPDAKVNWSKSMDNPNDSLTTNVFRAVTKYSAPVLATMPVAGPLAGITAGMAADFFGMDPKDDRLSNLILEHAPSVKNVPVAYDVLQYLKKKPDETELESRFKNMIEGLGVAVPVTAGILAVSKFASKAKAAKATIKANTQAVANPPPVKSVEGVPAIENEVAVVANRMSDSIVSASEQGKRVTVPRTPEELADKWANQVTHQEATADFAANVWERKDEYVALAKKMQKGAASPEDIAKYKEMSIEMENSLDAFMYANTKGGKVLNFRKQPPVEPGDRAALAAADDERIVSVLKDATPDQFEKSTKTFPELVNEGNAIIKDPAKVESLLNWKKGDRPLTGGEVAALKQLKANLGVKTSERLKQAAQSGTDEDMVIAFNSFDAYTGAEGLHSGTGSAAGETLSAYKILAEASGVRVSDANKALTAEGKLKLLKNQIDAAGGSLVTKEAVDAWKVIDALTPDQVQAKLYQVAQASKGNFKKASEIMAGMAVNAMLGIKTAGTTILGSSFLLGKNTVDNYIAAGIGAIRTARGSEAEVVSFKQANAYLKANMFSMAEGFANAARTFGQNAPINPAQTLKTGLFSRTSFTAEGLGVPVERSMGFGLLGKVVDGTGAITSASGRMIMTADSFFSTLSYRAKAAQEVMAAGERAGLEGDDLLKYFEKEMTDLPVEIHALAKNEADTISMAKRMNGENFFAGKGMGDFVEATTDWINDTPQLNVVLPFFNVTANIVDQSVRHSPLAIAGLANSKTRAAILAGGREADVAIAHVASASAMMGMFAYMASEGVLSGPEPVNPQLKGALQESGVGLQFNSVKIGKEWYSIRGIDLLNNLTNLGFILSKSRSYLSEGEYATAASLAATAVADTLTPEMMVSTFGGLFGAMKDASEYGQQHGNMGVGKFLMDNLTKYMPAQGVLRDVKQGILDDKVRRDVRPDKTADGLTQFIQTFSNKYSAVVPWLGQDLPLNRNIMGEATLVPDGFGLDVMSSLYESKAKGSETMQTLQKLTKYYELRGDTDSSLNKLFLKKPSDILEIEGIPLQLNPQEYDRYQAFIGNIDPKTGKSLDGDLTLRESITQVLMGFKNIDENMSPLVYNEILGELNSVFSAARERGMAYMLQDQEVMNKFIKAQDMMTKPQKNRNFKGED